MSALEILPAVGVRSSGEERIAFAPPAHTFSLTNKGTQTMAWSASVDRDWVVLSSTGGDIEEGKQLNLSVAIDQVRAADLSVGTHSATLLVRDESSGVDISRGVALEVTDGGLALTPTDGFESLGVLGGPFSPNEGQYTFSNIGTVPVDWQATIDVSWAQLGSTASGQLAVGANDILIATIDSTVASTLPVGSHRGTLTLTSSTHGESVQRALTLEIYPTRASDLDVVPGSGLTAWGEEGGPFVPSSLEFTLQNSGSQTLGWSTSVSEPWILVSSAGRSLAGGSSTPLTVSVDASVVNALSLGVHVGTVSIRDDSAGVVIDRDVSIRVQPSGSLPSASVLTQFGITWKFDRPHPVGQFANGDWWVVGPVSVVAISPISANVAGRISNGSMLNPSPRSGSAQGFDTSMYAQYREPGSYDPNLNVAIGVSPTNPLTLPAGSSLVSSISVSAPDQRPQLSSAAVLTVLSGPAQPGDFRPPYAGTDKTLRFNESQLDESLLQQLPIPASIASELATIPEAERMFERPWIDHIPTWIGLYAHPSQNMPDYGRQIADNVGVGALLLHLNFPTAQKHTLLVRYVQLGIDLFGVVQDGGKNNWRSSAGHMSGRKWPILFAGLMLGHAPMFNIGFDPSVQFGEDGQTFVIQETPPGSGIYNNGHGGFTAAEVGIAEWGTNHTTQPWFDDANWFGDPYRVCCTANAWWGQLLAAYIMDARVLWNHEPLFDYQDRYLLENRARGVLDWRLTWRDWYLDLWDTYRGNY